MLRRLALTGMVALLVGAAACTETPEPETPEPAQDNSIEAIRTRANAGDADAQAVLGYMYVTGDGVPQDDVEAVAWYLKAAEQGHASAQFNLGMMSYTGEGVPQDDVDAIEWLNADSEWRDDVEAVAWYLKAAEQGHADAQAVLGYMYVTGRGVPQDDGEAYLWANLAATYADADQREEFAEARDRASARLTPEQRVEGQKRSREFFEAHPPE